MIVISLYFVWFGPWGPKRWQGTSFKVVLFQSGTSLKKMMFFTSFFFSLVANSFVTFFTDLVTSDPFPGTKFCLIRPKAGMQHWKGCLSTFPILAAGNQDTLCKVCNAINGPTNEILWSKTRWNRFRFTQSDRSIAGIDINRRLILVVTNYQRITQG